MTLLYSNSALIIDKLQSILKRFSHLLFAKGTNNAKLLALNNQKFN